MTTSINQKPRSVISYAYQRFLNIEGRYFK